MNATLNKSAARGARKFLLENRLRDYFNSPCRIHAGDEIRAAVLQFVQSLGLQSFDFWQQETDRVLLYWMRDAMSTYDALNHLAMLKNQLHMAETLDASARQSISAMLDSSWQLLNSAYLNENADASTTILPPLLKLYSGPE